jgi:hypothetical protein
MWGVLNRGCMFLDAIFSLNIKKWQDVEEKMEGKVV